MDIDKNPDKTTTIGYVNWRGEQSMRSIIPQRMFYGTNDYYTTPQWIIEAWDIGRGGMRSFALSKIRHVNDMAHRWGVDPFNDPPEPPALPEGSQLANELAQAILVNDEKAALVAFVTIVGKLLDTQNESVAAVERIAATLENAKSPREPFYTTTMS